MGMATGEPLYDEVVKWQLRPSFRRWFLSEGDRLVRIKSLRPQWGSYGLEWPVLVIKMKGYGQMTITPCWTWQRLLLPWRTVEVVRRPSRDTTMTFN